MDHPEDEEAEESPTVCVGCQRAGREAEAGSAVMFAPCRLVSSFLEIS